MSSQLKITSSVLALLLFGAAVSLYAGFMATDPGVRGDPPGAGGPIDSLSTSEGLFFDAGLIQSIDDDTILANKNSQSLAKLLLGISGRPNTNGNDGTITRFGWKAQVKSLGIFSGEAYNVEQGVTNELFPQERDETAGCLFNTTPENHTNFEATQPTDVPSDAVKFALFMSFLAPPAPAPDTPSTINGRRLFKEIGCALCHTPSLHTGNVSSPALRGKQANLFSDLLLHNMGPKLAQNILQGNAKGDELRTPPQRGTGQPN